MHNGLKSLGRWLGRLARAAAFPGLTAVLEELDRTFMLLGGRA